MSMTEQSLSNNLGRYDRAFQYKLFSELLKPNNINLRTKKGFVDEIIQWLNPNYFEDAPLRRLSTIYIDYYSEYKVAPNIDNLNQIVSSTLNDEIEKQEISTVLTTIKDRVLPKYINGEMNNDSQYIKDETLKFIKAQEYLKLSNSIQQKINNTLFSEKTINEITESFKLINQIGQGYGYGVEVFDNIDNLLKDDFRQPLGIGIDGIDDQLEGGPKKGELVLIIAAQGVGKSTTLSHCGATHIRKNRKVLHIVLEGDKDEIRRKYVSAFTEVDVNKIGNETKEQIKTKIKDLEESGINFSNLIIERLPDGTKCSQFKKFVLDVEEKRGIQFEVILLDYIDELEPDFKSIGKYDNEETVVKFVESMAYEMDKLIISPVQGKKETNLKRLIEASDCGGSVAKLKKAHLVIGLGRDAEQLNTGYADFSIIKCRFARGGQYFENCRFNPDNMKITITKQVSFNLALDISDEQLDAIANKQKLDDEAKREKEQKQLAIINNLDI